MDPNTQQTNKMQKKSFMHESRLLWIFSPRLCLEQRGMGGSDERRNAAARAGCDAVVWAHNINEYNDATRP